LRFHDSPLLIAKQWLLRGGLLEQSHKLRLAIPLRFSASRLCGALPAATPKEAVEKAKNHSGAIDLLMTDVVLPEMNGRDLAAQIAELYPGARFLFMSGYTANVIAHQGGLNDVVAFIQKPFSMADMTVKVREVLDKASDGTQV